MAHLASTFESYETFLDQADNFFIADLTALNSSNVSGSAIFALSRDENGESYLNVSVVANGVTPNQSHGQHVHGRFDDDGDPMDSISPDIADDADRDGIVEVLEGLPDYGDILLPLVTADGMNPMADAGGTLQFIQNYDIDDAANFFSPVTGNDYTFADLSPLTLREYVIHGQFLAEGIGAGTEGEADGTAGFKGLLPVASGEITAISYDEARAAFETQIRNSSSNVVFDGDDDTFYGGPGSDRVLAGRGEDLIFGGDGDDSLFGLADNDRLFGGEGNDLLNGGSGDDTLEGGIGDDVLLGGAGNDELVGGSGDDVLVGYGGNDTMVGGKGNDQMAGGGGNDDMTGNAGDDLIFGGGRNDMISGGTGDDVIGGGSGNDRLFGDAGNDFMNGAAGDDLVVGGDGDDVIFGGSGQDILGGGAGRDRLTGGSGRDEFHFNGNADGGAGLDGGDFVRDFTQGEDVISFLDDGAISFANSQENDSRGDSDLNVADFDTVVSVAGLDAGNDQQVVYSTGTALDAATLEASVAVEAYLAATDGVDTFIYYDADWSTAEDRELVARLDNFTDVMTASDFDVY